MNSILMYRYLYIRVLWDYRIFCLFIFLFTFVFILYMYVFGCLNYYRVYVVYVHLYMFLYLFYSSFYRFDILMFFKYRVLFLYFNFLKNNNKFITFLGKGCFFVII